MINKQYLKSFAGAFRFNLKGATVKEKLIIIESDDWGAIRTPSAEALQAFFRNGQQIKSNIYNLDALESTADIATLFNVIREIKGSDGRPAKITANMVVANPDFSRIKDSEFQEYYFEKLPDTYHRYPMHSDNMKLWSQGLQENLVMTQFHGREHLNFNRWLSALRSGDKETLFCFDHGSTSSGNGSYSYMEAFDWDTPNDIPEQATVIREGLSIFEDYFGFRSESFIAPCYNWDPRLEAVLSKEGVKMIQGSRFQRVPTGTFDQYTPIRHYFGEMNKYGTYYNIRNCFFEPAMNPKRDWVNSCLAQITNAFMMHKPAVICSHRVNYIGFINVRNRDDGLCQLSELLKKIVRKWPDARFISTDQLVDILEASSQSI